MSVVAFRSEVGMDPKGLWRAEEMRQLTGCLAAIRSRGHGSWAVDAPRTADPQLYVLGQRPTMIASSAFRGWDASTSSRTAGAGAGRA